MIVKEQEAKMASGFLLGGPGGRMTTVWGEVGERIAVEWVEAL